LAALENLNDSENRIGLGQALKSISKASAKESPGLYDLKQHKLWFDVECL